jgi:3-deoxy-manno-octulosonate cytidylyltransferase (CMP-KDO synthetase)
MGTRPDYRYRQIGIYAFRSDVLRAFSRLEPTPGEIAESCDMLRFVEHGYAVHMVVSTAVLQSVDTADDLRAAEALMQSDPYLAAYAADGVR